MWAAAVPGGDSEPQAVHLKVDTGMVRLGLMPGEVAEALEVLAESGGLRLVGLLSHLAEADDALSERTEAQRKAFEEILRAARSKLGGGMLRHVANSAATIHVPKSRYDLVRLGLALYGADPRNEFSGLTPVMSVVSRIVQLKEVDRGARVGYGGRWQAQRRSRLGVVPIGYAEGYLRSFSNRAHVLVEGRRCPVVGAVSMDMCMVDLTDCSQGEGAEVVLLGKQGSERIEIRELAGIAETIPYELLCLLGLRLSRRYRNGGAVEAADWRCPD
jgi:alanine racemase